MTSTDPTPLAPSDALLRGIAAALERPVLLDPRAVQGVCGAAAFYAQGARADAAAGDDAPFVRDGDAAVVAVRGPLAQRAWSCFGMYGGDGYDAIEARVRAALADPATRGVVLRLDSPGGEVAGCFEAVRAIRAAVAAAGKPLVAYVDEVACSAAYALACAADAVVLPASGAVGSVGVIVALVDRSAQLEQDGIAVHVIASGARKADGHPAVALSPNARAAVQAEIDYLADVFAAEVAAARGLTPQGVRALEAAVFYGPAAVAARLADRVGGFADAIAMSRSLAATRKPAGRSAAATRGKTMSTLPTALGLGPDATEAEQLAAVHALRDFRTQARAIAGQDDDAEALGALKGHKDAAAKVPALEAQVAAAAAAAAQADRDALVAEGRRDGKLTPAHLDPATKPGAFLASLSTPQLRGYLATAPRVVPAGTVAEPAKPLAAALGGKPWAELKPAEKARLFQDDRAAYDALKAAGS